MNIRQFVAPTVSTLFGLYCVVWGLLASSSPASLRIGGAFLGMLFLLLALVYVRLILPHKPGEGMEARTTAER